MDPFKSRLGFKIWNFKTILSDYIDMNVLLNAVYNYVWTAPLAG